MSHSAVPTMLTTPSAVWHVHLFLVSTHLSDDFLSWSELGDEDVIVHRPQPPFPLETLHLIPVRAPLHGTAGQTTRQRERLTVEMQQQHLSKRWRGDQFSVPTRSRRWHQKMAGWHDRHARIRKDWRYQPTLISSRVLATACEVPYSCWREKSIQK